MIEISVQIMTFHRDESLRRAVASVFAQRGIDPALFEILIVDNSPEGSARATVAALTEEARKLGILMLYVQEPKPGIPNARNAGVRSAQTELIAYIDDDEEAEPDWLANLYAALKRYNADAMVGPVRSIFDDTSLKDDPFWNWVYNYDEQLPTGSTFRATGTGNCLFVKARCCLDDHPFDPAYVLTGGSDTRFFHALGQRHLRVLWCAEAMVHEHVPVARTALRYAFRRRMRQSQLFVQTFSWNKPVDWFSIAKWMVIGAAQAAIYVPVGALLWGFSRPLAKRYLALGYGGLGKLFWPHGITLIGYGRSRAR